MTCLAFIRTIFNEHSKRKRFCVGGIVSVLCACVIALTFILIKFLSKTKSNGLTNDVSVTLTTTVITRTEVSVFASITILNTSESTTTSSVTNSLNRTSTIDYSSYWISDAFLIAARSVHQSALLANGKVIVAGGHDTTTSKSSCEFYSSSTGWQAVTSMKNQRAFYTLTLFDNNTKLLATGGLSGTCQKTAEIFDSTTNTWTLTSTNMLIERCGHTATLLGNGQILIAGGLDSSDISTSAAEIYIPSSNSFIKTNNMRLSRGYATSTLLNDGSTVLVTGGFYDKKDATLTAELYINGSWIRTNNSMMHYRVHHSAILLNDGNVLIAGGDDGGSLSYLNVEIYNATTRRFTPVGSMKYGRALFTLTLLPSGKVLATGGVDWHTKTCPRVCELYDPVTRSWSDTRLLNNGRCMHQTILLNDSVLTVGGEDVDGSILASSEKYYF